MGGVDLFATARDCDIAVILDVVGQQCDVRQHWEHRPVFFIQPFLREMVLGGSAEVDVNAFDRCIVHGSALVADLLVRLRQGVWHESGFLDICECVLVDPVAQFRRESQERGGDGDRNGGRNWCGRRRHRGLMFVWS